MVGLGGAFAGIGEDLVSWRSLCVPARAAFGDGRRWYSWFGMYNIWLKSSLLLVVRRSVYR